MRATRDSDTIVDLYAVLGIPSIASANEIRQAYRARVKAIHPDRFNRTGQAREWTAANARLIEINRAYAVLSDPVARAQFNRRREKQYNIGSSVNSQESRHGERHRDQNRRGMVVIVSICVSVAVLLLGAVAVSSSDIGSWLREVRR